MSVKPDVANFTLKARRCGLPFPNSSARAGRRWEGWARARPRRCSGLRGPVRRPLAPFNTNYSRVGGGGTIAFTFDSIAHGSRAARVTEAVSRSSPAPRGGPMDECVSHRFGKIRPQKAAELLLFFITAQWTFGLIHELNVAHFTTTLCVNTESLDWDSGRWNCSSSESSDTCASSRSSAPRRMR